MATLLESGTCLGRYELLAELGRGGMASVWVARETGANGAERLVAVKAVLPELSDSENFRSMFLEEGQIIRSIDHPNVVKVHDVGEVHGVLFMAMEWIEGTSLRVVFREALKRSPIPSEMATKIIADVAAGLHAAHELRGWDGGLRGVVHCDVTPHNILLGIDGSIKLVDFGVASATAHGGLDAPGRLKGKFGYMSPEQARGEVIDRRTDLFALGVVLYELTTGRRLFKHEDPKQALKLVTEGSFPRPSELVPGYPATLEAVVMKALAKSASQRFQTAAHFRAALEKHLVAERTVVARGSIGALLRRVAGVRVERQRAEIRAALHRSSGAPALSLVPTQKATSDSLLISKSVIEKAAWLEEPTQVSAPGVAFIDPDRDGAYRESSSALIVDVARRRLPAKSILPALAVCAAFAAGFMFLRPSDPPPSTEAPKLGASEQGDTTRVGASLQLEAPAPAGGPKGEPQPSPPKASAEAPSPESTARSAEASIITVDALPTAEPKRGTTPRRPPTQATPTAASQSQSSQEQPAQAERRSVDAPQKQDASPAPRSHKPAPLPVELEEELDVSNPYR